MFGGVFWLKKRINMQNQKKQIDYSQMSDQELIKIIASGCKFEYLSYDHKKALQEFKTNEEFQELRKIVANPKCYDMPDSLKEKYQIKKIGKIRRIDFNPIGKPWRFKIGAKYAKTFFKDDFGTKVFPIINEIINSETKTQSEDFARFETGDVISFCDEHYFVIENNGNTGVVNPVGENFYIRNFYWQFSDQCAKFVRKPTQIELKSLGFENGSGGEKSFIIRINSYLESECSDYDLSYSFKWEPDIACMVATIKRDDYTQRCKELNFKYDTKADDLSIELSEDSFYVTREFDETVKYFWMLISPELFPNA